MHRCNAAPRCRASGLEGALTDVTARRIIDEVITGDFASGISDGAERILRVVDGEPLPAPAQRQQDSSGLLGHIDPFNPFLLFGVFIVGGIFRGLPRRRWRYRLSAASLRFW
jgi:uncharacterized protein